MYTSFIPFHSTGPFTRIFHFSVSSSHFLPSPFYLPPLCLSHIAFFISIIKNGSSPIFPAFSCALSECPYFSTRFVQFDLINSIQFDINLLSFLLSSFCLYLQNTSFKCVLVSIPVTKGSSHQYHTRTLP